MAKILFIEDSKRWQEEIRLILATAGHSLESANSFELAMEKIKANNFDVVVFDLFLGVEQTSSVPFVWLNAMVDGMLARKLHIPPIIVVTGYPIPPLGIVELFTKHRGIVFHFFDKSNFDMQQFLEAIKEAVNYPNLTIPTSRSTFQLLVFSLFMTVLLLSIFGFLVRGTNQIADPTTQQVLLKAGGAIIIALAIFISIFSQGSKLETVLASIIKAWRG